MLVKEKIAICRIIKLPATQPERHRNQSISGADEKDFCKSIACQASGTLKSWLFLHYASSPT